MKLSRIGDKDDQMIVGFGDTSFKTEEKAVGGVFLFLKNLEMTRAVPIYWRAKTIERVCHSSKDAETLIMSRMVDDAVFAAKQLEMLVFGEYNKRIKVTFSQILNSHLSLSPPRSE